MTLVTSVFASLEMIVRIEGFLEELWDFGALDRVDCCLFDVLIWGLQSAL